MQTATPLTWDALKGLPVHMVGIKGNGMAALAATLHGAGARVAGSDTGEIFFTDEVLDRLGLKIWSGFDAAHVDPDVRVVVYSPAFSPTANPELLEATRRGLPILSYPEALGAISRQFDASGIAGSHGKTTTTALCAVLARALDLDATVMVPTLLPDLDRMPVYGGGKRFFVTETCEYRRNFLSFSPRRIVLTTVEAEHLDYYRDFADVCDAFAEYARLLPAGGTLVHNADDPGCRAVLERLAGAPLDYLPYGREAAGDYRITDLSTPAGRVRFGLAGSDAPFELRVPGAHNAFNAAAALALICSLSGAPLSRQNAVSVERLRAALLGFRGTARRAEVVGEARGVTILDDYGHHPTEVRVTLEGLKSFYEGRRLVVDFMPHTYSRTKALFADFLGAFGAADEVILHRIYASAREHDDGTVTGGRLADELGRRHPAVRYFEEPLDAVGYLAGSLHRGDVLVTMGAGDNGKVGRAVLARLAGGAA
jgi:UDP-N-acetylmuramate--alanine ligase